MRLFEQTRTHVVAVLSPEKLLFDALGLHSRSAHDDKGSRRPVRPVMQQTRRHFFADARRARYQYATSGPRDALQRRTDRIDGARHAVQLVIAAAARLQDFVFTPQPLCFGGALDKQYEPFGLEGLFDKIDSTPANRRDGRIDASMPRDNQNRQRWILRLQHIE